MMAETMLRSEERIGLALAVIAHAGLVALLVLRPPSTPFIPPPERITVTLSENAGLISTSPEPQADAAPDVAPEFGEAPPPEPEPLPLPSPEPLPPKPTPPRPTPLKPAPKLKVEPRVTPSPAPRPSPRAVQAPAPKPAAKTPPSPERTGGSRIGSDFLKGVAGASSTGTSRNPPAAAIGPAVQSALSGAISRQLKPRWAAPQGADAEKLVTILSWNLNRDGTLSGVPRVLRQEGITEANRPQAARHAEQAIRAVQLAAPFDLPAEYYDAWKRVASFRFDKRLSQ